MDKLQLFFQEMQEYQYISFDIFDTLLKRTVSEPCDIFELIQWKYNSINDKKISNFKAKRISAERKARRISGQEEVSLNDIYSNLSFSSNVKENLMEIECFIETECCCQNKPVVELYEKCKQAGKKVIITSDMYLPQHVIEKMLDKLHIIGYYKLFLSSSIGMTKRSGNLYKYLLKDLGITCNELIHIGNDACTDYSAPQRLGIRSCLYEEPEISGFYWNKNGRNILENHFISCAVNQCMITNDPSYNLGYGLVGPFIVQFCLWLHKEAFIHKLGKIVFLSREGWLLHHVYLQMYPEDINIVSYLNINRNTLRLPMLYMDDSIQQFVKLISNESEYTMQQLCGILLPEMHLCDAQRLLDRHDLQLSTIIKVKEMRHNPTFVNFYYECVKIARAEMKNQYLLLKKYLEQNNLDNRIALVNNSMHGSVQSYLKSIFPEKHFWGMHFILTKKGKKRIDNQCSIWFGKTCRQFDKRCFCRNSLLFEHMLFEDCGTAKYYKDNTKGLVAAICEVDLKETENARSLVNFRRGVDDFVRFFQSTLPVIVDGKICLEALCKLLRYPLLRDAQFLCQLYDSDIKGILHLADYWKQGLLTIKGENAKLHLYNIYLHLEMIKRIFW